MKKLLLDTSNRYLTVACFEQDQCVSYIHQEAIKTQSELVVSAIDDCFKQAGWKTTDLNAIVLSVGPGSYTGVRIAMTVAKVLFATANIPLYTTTSFQIVAGNHPNTMVIFDARSQRVYAARVSNGLIVEEPFITTIEHLKEIQTTYDGQWRGDVYCLDLPEQSIDIVENLKVVIQHAQIVEHPHQLVPMYLKEWQEYQK